MGLDFTHIKDQTGAALYMLHDGSHTQQRTLERLADEIRSKGATHQVVLLSARDRDGEKVRDFYDLNQMNFPHILIVGDDDQIISLWSGHHLPSADHVSYALSTSSPR